MGAFQKVPDSNGRTYSNPLPNFVWETDRGVSTPGN
ncbi:hypothetical protein Pan14r_11640 [Crateriforma conspicua]|uniref:Uncharacterized protein n=1 Tax=Crateriforma conspicua TaxID=2527996 RepID=A0A5C5Y2J3_9PLAN|nr:hypothetical protein Pan14r_11640 [Crateriforma conspicua]